MTGRFKSAGAQQFYAADIDDAIKVIGKYIGVMRDEAQRLESMRIEFSYLQDHTMPDGSYRIMTAPVN